MFFCVWQTGPNWNPWLFSKGKHFPKTLNSRLVWWYEHNRKDGWMRMALCFGRRMFGTTVQVHCCANVLLGSWCGICSALTLRKRSYQHSKRNEQTWPLSMMVWLHSFNPSTSASTSRLKTEYARCSRIRLIQRCDKDKKWAASETRHHSGGPLGQVCLGFYPSRNLFGAVASALL